MSEQQPQTIDGSLKKGVAPIKKEYLIENKAHVINLDFVSEQDADRIKTTNTAEAGDAQQEPGEKRPRIDDRDNPHKKLKSTLR